jgi:solute carrier family 35 protein E1
MATKSSLLVCLSLALCGHTLAWTLPKPVSKLPQLHRSPLSKDAQAVMPSTTKAKAYGTALEAATATYGGDDSSGSLMETLKVGGYFGLWYALNIGYNIYNKKALNLVKLPWTMALIQLFAGIPYVMLLWATGLRKAPVLNRENIKNLTPSALCHLGTHVGAVLSLGAGAVSFTHIVKASEPVVSALLSAVFLKQFLPIPVYISLLPVIGGVGLASLKELSFTWLAFSTAMLSNVASASRAILSKGLMNKPVGENLNAPNL